MELPPVAHDASDNLSLMATVLWPLVSGLGTKLPHET